MVLYVKKWSELDMDFIFLCEVGVEIELGVVFEMQDILLNVHINFHLASIFKGVVALNTLTNTILDRHIYLCSAYNVIFMQILLETNIV